MLKSGGGRVSAMYGAHRTDLEPVAGTITDGHTWSAAADAWSVAVGADNLLDEYPDRSRR